MFDALSDKLQRVFGRLSSHGTVTEKDLDEALREVRVALLEADVNFRVVREFINAVRERAIGAEVLTIAQRPAAGHQDRQRRADEHARRRPGEPHDRAAAAHRHPAPRPQGRRQDDLRLPSSPSTCARAAASPCSSPPTPIVSPPAQQLQTLGRQYDIAVFAGDPKDVKTLARDALAEARRIGATALIVDSAGYVQLDEDVIEEIKELETRLQAARDAARRRRHDRSGSRPRRRGVRQRHDDHRLRPHQARRRCPRWRRALDPRHHRPADQVHRHRRARRRPRALPPGALRLAHPRHGRRPDADREGAGQRRRGQMQSLGKAQ